MCVGLKVEEPLSGVQLPDTSTFTTPNQKRRNSDVRKEKAKDAARNRRTQESDYFEDLERLLPVSGPPPTSQQTALDKTSIIRLSVAHLKTRDVLQNGLQMRDIKEEVAPEIDVFECLDGFTLTIGTNGDVIFVSENVSKYIGLTQVELLGQDFSDYVHPCDHQELRKLTQKKTIGSDDELVEMFVRVKCTVTERGRMINLKQANYKPLKLTGKCRSMAEKESGGVTGNIFLGVARPVVEREVMVDQQIGVFTTKHSVDMRFMETDPWMSVVASYSTNSLMGVSFFELVHAQDIVNVQKAFKNLKDHGQCETPPYRLLCYGGGFAWVQTQACLAATRRGSSKGQTVSCSHQQISEVMNKDEILSIIQMKAEKSTPSTPMKDNNASLSMKPEEQSIIEEPQVIQFEIFEQNISPAVINRNTEKTNLRAIKIEPRQSSHINKNPRISIGLETKVSSTPTSVIVRCQKPQPEVKSVSIFEKQVKEFDDSEGNEIKSVTDSLWTTADALTIATEPIFHMIEPDIENCTVIQEEILEPVWIPAIPEEENIVAVNENEFFEEIFTGIQRLDKLSPYCGEQRITLSKMNEREASEFESVNFDDLICLDFSEDCAEFLFNEKSDMPNKEGGKLSNQVEHLAFDEEQVLIDPERNTMWGLNNQSTNKENNTFDILLPGNGISGQINWRNEEVKNTNNSNLINGIVVRDNFDNTMPGYISYQNQNDHCFDPPGDKILCRPKIGSTVPQKRVITSDILDNNYFVKKKRFDLENEKGSTVTHVHNITDMIVVNTSGDQVPLKFWKNGE